MSIEKFEKPIFNIQNGLEYTKCQSKKFEKPTFSLIVVVNLLYRFVMFDVCACLWSAL